MITFRVSQDPAAGVALRRLSEAFRDQRPLLRALGAAAVAQTRRRFILKRTPSGASWKPSDSPKGTLVREGYLRDHIHARLVGDSAVEIGSPEPYAAVHQFGATIRPKNKRALHFRVGSNGGWVTTRSVTIPPRPYLGVSDDDRAQFLAMIERHVQRALSEG